MFLAEGAAEGQSLFHWFDLIIIAITLILAWAVVRQIKQRPKNLFALGFATVSLLAFLVIDVIMVKGW
ncbi:hypothetical protein [Paenibacillus marinisediminis]